MVVAPNIGVLALQGDVREHLYALERCGASTSTVRTPDQLATVDALVIPGGESSTMDKLLRAFDMHVPLQLRVQAGLPVYGSCAGLIALANTIHGGMVDQCTVGGMDIVVRRNAFGRQVDSFETDLLIDGINHPERPFRAVFIRAPWVESVGDAVEVLATVPARGDVPERVVAVRQGSLLATSFHPELTDDHRVHGLFVDMVRAA